MATISLSDDAPAPLRRRYSGERVAVTAATRETYRELTRAGLAEPVSGFMAGPEAHFRLTKEACDRRAECTESAGCP